MGFLKNDYMKSLFKWYSGLNIYYKLFPFLLLYVTICIVFPKDVSIGDQVRYLGFADNLLNGFYSPPYPNIDLWNGPGYPAFLVPFIFIKVPFVGLRLLNAFLLYFSLIISYKTFSIYSSKNSAILFTMLLGLYFPIFEVLRQILTESLAWFLISLVCFLVVKNYQQKNISWKLVLLAAFSIAYLAMTKVIFGYVILLMLFISIFMFLLPIFRSSAKKSALIFLVSLFFCLPWLIYTYNLTDKIFYWSNSGSMSLYTMSTPYVGESGQWYDQELLLKNPNHTVFIDSILRLTPLQQDDAYKKAAITNIRNHPAKYLTNFISNIGRLLFFPSDYAPDTIFSYYPFVPNMFIVVFIVITMAVSLVHYKRIPPELILLFMFIFIYLFGSTVVSAYRRMFHITMPFWFFFFSYVFNNLISIKIKQN